MAAILVHDNGISLATIPKPSSSSSGSTSLNPTPLALPTRFPKGAKLQSSVALNGAIYLWSTESPIIWEYNTSGKRVGEMSMGGRVRTLCPVNGKASTLCVAVGGEVKMMVKESGKWGCVKIFQGPSGDMTSLVSSRRGEEVLAASSSEVVKYDLVTGTRRPFELRGLRDPERSRMTFVPSLPHSLLVHSASSPSLSLVDLDTMGIREIKPFSSTTAGRIGSIAFSPMVETSQGKKGGLCAALREGTGEVALIGLDSQSAAKVIDFGTKLTSVQFIDGASLAGLTAGGTLLLKDLRALSTKPVELNLGWPITSVHAIPSAGKTRPSTAPTTTAPGSVLGEARNRTNMNPTAAPAPVSVSSKEALDNKVRQKEKEEKRRIVSAPTVSPTQRESQPERERSSSSRAGSSTVPPRAARAGTAIQQHTPVIEEEGEEQADELNLSWVLRPAKSLPLLAQPPPADSLELDEMRRQIGDLQMDILRMKRNFKHELRMATQLLQKELEEKDRTIERQRREIESLRR